MNTPEALASPNAISRFMSLSYSACRSSPRAITRAASSGSGRHQPSRRLWSATALLAVGIRGRIEQGHRAVPGLFPQERHGIGLLVQLSGIAPAEFGPPRRVVAEPAAQLWTRRHVLEPEINGSSGLLDAPRPDPIDQHAKAVVRCRGLVDALDADHDQPPFGAAFSISSSASTEWA